MKPFMALITWVTPSRSRHPEADTHGTRRVSEVSELCRNNAHSQKGSGL
jgi:hypothetical protein